MCMAHGCGASLQHHQRSAPCKPGKTAVHCALVRRCDGKHMPCPLQALLNLCLLQCRTTHEDQYLCDTGVCKLNRPWHGRCTPLAPLQLNSGPGRSLQTGSVCCAVFVCRLHVTLQRASLAPDATAVPAQEPQDENPITVDARSCLDGLL